MKPIEFKEMNTTQEKSAEKKKKDAEQYPTAGKVQQLPARNYPDRFISCWKLSWRDKLSVLFFGRVWLMVYCGIEEHPPIGMICERDIFKAKKTGEVK